MKYCLFIILCCLPVLLSAQQPFHVQNAMTAHEKNYQSFTPQYRHISEEAKLKNADFVTHPELGMLFAEAPVSDCYELIGERTENTKTFIKEGSGGKEIMLQTSTDVMHYKDADGQWRTITTRLQPAGKGIYTADAQPMPVNINAIDRYTKLGKEGEFIRFNNQLELVYLAPDGKEKSLGTANWKNNTAGDDGVYVTDAWKGIDIEMSVSRGAVKTNFIIQHAMGKYAAGKLLVRDHLKMADGLELVTLSQRQCCTCPWLFNDRSQIVGDIQLEPIIDYKGNLVICKGGKATYGISKYDISAATAYEQNNVQGTLQMIGYNVHGNTLDIVIPGDFLNRPASSYPVVIDPLVSTATTSTVGGSSYSPAKTVSCNYVNAATVPANVRVTDVRWTFNYISSGGAQLLHGGVDYTLGSCRSPSVTGFFWYCNLASTGTCTGTNVSIFSDISSCIPAPTCASYPLNLNMRFYQNFATTLPCATTYITSASPLTITVFGRTVEASAVSSVGGLTSVCLGQSVTLSTTTTFGVPPYTYSWTPGTTTGNPSTFTPTVTTPYTVTVTDACGQTATAAQTIAVNSIPANTGTPIVCIGGTTTLSNPTGPGTWTSSTGAVAVVGPSSGIVTGVSPGTTIISFTNSVGCYATTVVTVIPMPTAITGTPSLCVGAVTPLSNPMTGGTWSSGNISVAIVGPGTGVVTGISPGTAVISYVTSPGCLATIIVTVYANPTITSASFVNPTTCGATDGSITFNGLTPGVVYDVTYTGASGTITLPITANAAGQIIITGLPAGIYLGFLVKTPQGCTTTYDLPITLVDTGTPPVPIAANNSPICDGGIINFTATSSPGVVYVWTGPAGFSSTLQNPSINPASLAVSGVYSVTASVLGCVSLPGTTTVIVNPLPHVAELKTTNPVTCGGSEGSLVLTGLTPGVTYNVGFTHDGAASFIPVIADALGNATVYGRAAGTYTYIFAEISSCVSNLLGPVTLVDPAGPPPPSMGSNAPICVGLTLYLYGNDDKFGGTYSWAGPNGFTSSLQNPSIPFVPAEAQGVYTLTYTRLNCSSSSTADIQLQPVIKLKDVTATRYVIPFGDSVQLNASGATYYNWTPHNGTISNHFIFNPFVKPRDSIATYTVYGNNEWGCRDSANLTLIVIFDEDEYIPNSFTPNGDGKNDIFRVGKMKYKKMVDFTIYNRWGQEVYHNPYDPYGGWDGTMNGKPQDVGVYFYSIMVETASGKMKYYKGDVTLLR